MLAIVFQVRAGDYLPIYGGPTYDSTIGNGYQNEGLNFSPGSTATSGMGVGQADNFVSGVNLGPRSIRWNSLGTPMVLDNLGTNSSGFTISNAYSVNAVGTAVGFAVKFISAVNEGERAVRWDGAGTLATELGNLGTNVNGSSNSRAYAINISGTAVGDARKYVSGSYLGPRAVRWDASGTNATELDNLGTDPSGFAEGHAYSINSGGIIVGDAYKYVGGNGGPSAVRWNSQGVVTQLGSLGVDSNGVPNSLAWNINSSGTVVGYSYKYVGGISLGPRAIRWDAGSTVPTELGNLGTDINTGFTYSHADGINSSGTAVGNASKILPSGDKGARAVRWDAGSTIATELGILGTDASGASASDAWSISDYGIAAGYADEYDAAGHLLGRRAVMWGPNGSAIKLASLIDPASGWTNLEQARFISSDNWITGFGTFDPDGPGGRSPYTRVFLMQVPEPPSGVLLLVAGCLAFLTMLRRRCCAS